MRSVRIESGIVVATAFILKIVQSGTLCRLASKQWRHSKEKWKVRSNWTHSFPIRFIVVQSNTAFCSWEILSVNSKLSFFIHINNKINFFNNSTQGNKPVQRIYIMYVARLKQWTNCAKMPSRMNTKYVYYRTVSWIPHLVVWIWLLNSGSSKHLTIGSVWAWRYFNCVTTSDLFFTSSGERKN